MSTPPTNEPQYNANVPVTTDFLATSQGNFLNNFEQLYTAFLKNHVALDGGATAGNHKVIEMLEQPKGFQTDPGEISVYSKDVEGQTDQLFLGYQGNGIEVQLTNYQIYTLPIVTKPNGNAIQHGYFTILPGKVIVYFGDVFPKRSSTGNLLDLAPYVCKNVMGVNLCPLGTTPSYNPGINLIKNNSGIITTISLNLLSVNTGDQFFYLIFGNI